MAGIETSRKDWLMALQSMCDSSRAELRNGWNEPLGSGALAKKHTLPQIVDNLLRLGNNLS